MRGVIIKGIAGFYYVLAEGIVYECKARGIFKKQGITPLCGDEVEMSVIAGPGMQPSASSPEMGVGSVDDILPRLNSFSRPPVANVELMVLVCAVKHPAPSFLMLDKVALCAQAAGAEVVICLNKTDLDGKKKNKYSKEENPEGSETQSLVEAFKEHYKNACKVICTSAKDGSGVDELRAVLKGKKAALTGPSGAGKSSLTNVLLSGRGNLSEVSQGEQKSRTGEISKKLGRGKNTTRHCELFEGDGFFLFDTPGFTSFDAQGVASSDAAKLFPDILPHLGKCRFSDCRHIAEPECAVIKAVEDGLVSKGRYESYKEIFSELKKAEEY